MLKYSKYIVLLLPLFFIQEIFSAEPNSIEQSTSSVLAVNSLLLQSDKHDSLHVVVGERGHILYSNDSNDWQQADVQSKKTLTNVFMLDKNTGYAVGHDAIILKTVDGAKSWKKMYSEINQEAPLLDILFKDDSNGIAIGAYSLFYTTDDGGISWNKQTIDILDNNISNESSEGIMTDIIDIHLNDIAYAGDKRFYIAAEAGHVLRTDDDGKTWLNLKLPYNGSFFGALPLSYDELIVYGLRGHLYHSSDAGKSWKKIETGSTEMLTNAALLSDGSVIVSGLAGTLLLSRDNGLSFSAIDMKHRHGLTSILETNKGNLLLTSDAGIESLSRNKVTSKK